MFFVYRLFNTTLRTDLSKNEVNFENIWIECKITLKNNLILGLAYNPERKFNCSIHEFLDFTIEQTSSENLADFNKDYLQERKKRVIRCHINVIQPGIFQQAETNIKNWPQSY